MAMMFGDELEITLDQVIQFVRENDQVIQFDDPVVSLESTNTGQRKRSRSKVWEEFTPILSAGKVRSARCNHCRKHLGAKSSAGTSHLSRHLKICAARAIVNGGCQKGSSSQRSSSVSKNWNFDQEKSIEELTRAIISNSCSFSMIDSTSVRNFLSGINPSFNLVPQDTTEERLLGIFHIEQSKLKEKITSTSGGVFLSLESWEHRDDQTFECLRVQFIDDDWMMNRRIIRFVCSRISEYYVQHYLTLSPDWNSFRNLYTGIFMSHRKAVKAVVNEAIDVFNLRQKILGLTLECTINSTVTLELEDDLSTQNYLVAKHKLLSIPCMVTALHDLFGWELNDLVLETSVSCFRYMTFSPVRKKKYEETLSKLRLSRPTFGSKIWYLTFYSLEAALQFFKAYPDIEELDPRAHLKLSSEQLEAAESFCKITWPIYHAIKVVSSPHHPTFNSYFNALWSLRTALQEASKMVNIKRVLDVEDMQRKFEENWRKWYLWLSLAVVLDPRYKIRFVELRCRQSFGHDADMYIAEVRGKIYELFIQYSCHVNQQSIDILNQAIGDLHLDTHGCESLVDTSQSYNNPEGHEEFKELNDYLGGEFYAQNDCFDILKWWKDHTSTYPTLARLARDILAIPGCTVSADSAFDDCDKQASLLYTKMSPEIVEAAICTQDWIKSTSETSHPNAHGDNINIPI